MADKNKDLIATKKIRIDIFRALARASDLSACPERDVLLNELRRAKAATAQLQAILGDKGAYITKD